MDDPGGGGGDCWFAFEGFGSGDGELGNGHARWGLLWAAIRREQGGLRLRRKLLLYSSLLAASFVLLLYISW